MATQGRQPEPAPVPVRQVPGDPDAETTHDLLTEIRDLLLEIRDSLDTEGD